MRWLQDREVYVGCRIERLKSKYENLNQMVLKTFESERMSLRKARQLGKMFSRFQESQKEEKNELDKLRTEQLYKAETDRQMVHEQVMTKSLEQAELKWQLKDDVWSRADGATRSNYSELVVRCYDSSVSIRST